MKKYQLYRTALDALQFVLSQSDLQLPDGCLSALHVAFEHILHKIEDDSQRIG